MTHFLSKAHHSPSRTQPFGQRRRIILAGLSRGEFVSSTWAAELEPRVVRHTLGCLLARVAGKSPLEYLTPAEATRQRDTVLSLMPQPPTSVPDLIDNFICKIETYANN